MILNDINRDSPITVIKQVTFKLINDIENGTYKKNDRLLSINNSSKQHGVARDTIERAYQKLIEQGYIISIPGKGYFVSDIPDKRIKVLFIFNTIDIFQRKVFESTISALGNTAKVDVSFYQNNLNRFDEIVETNLNKYNYLMVSTPFFYEASENRFKEILKKIPRAKLIILEKEIVGINYHSAIIQDFKTDIYSTLQSITEALKNYRRIILIFSIGRDFPIGIKTGIEQFCFENNKKFEILSTLNRNTKKETLFITLTDQGLVEIIKASNRIGYRVGHEIGIISYYDSPLKELLEITVMNTDLVFMGNIAASIILYNKPSCLKIPFNLIFRKSL